MQLLGDGAAAEVAAVQQRVGVGLFLGLIEVALTGVREQRRLQVDERARDGRGTLSVVGVCHGGDGRSGHCAAISWCREH